MLGAVPSAHAQGTHVGAGLAADGDDEQRALDLSMEAETAYREGDIERAVELLREARRLRQEPVLLYNLARAYETLGRLDDALAAYQRYLEEDPEANDRGAIETRIAALRRQIEERERLEREGLERDAASAPSPSPWPWVVFGVGGAGIGAAVVLGVLSLAARDEAATDPIHASAFASLRRAETFALTANVLYAVGGALTLAGAIWGVIDIATLSNSESSASISVGPGSVFVHVQF